MPREEAEVETGGNGRERKRNKGQTENFQRREKVPRGRLGG